MPEFEAVTGHIRRLELPWRFSRLLSLPVAVWLVHDGEHATLIDTGPPDTADLVVAAVAQATGGKGPQRILLTHAHYDHGGGIAALRRTWDPPVLCHRDEVPFVTGELDHRMIKPHSFASWVGRFLLKDSAWGQPVARDFERGQAAFRMVVIPLPGHSPGQVGFLHPEDHAFICGDAVMNLRGRLSPPLGLATPDPVQAEISLHRIGEIEFMHLLPSHGAVILKNGRSALLDFLERRVGGGVDITS
jgi:glyoxylase-like metal-dependent hydrolase (beta-lactamase superfamily II)